MLKIFQWKKRVHVSHWIWSNRVQKDSAEATTDRWSDTCEILHGPSSRITDSEVLIAYKPYTLLLTPTMAEAERYQKSLDTDVNYS